ncbi:hypothetical protein CSB37_02675 [bacterium DOLZORAL124_38_8]|nr:MAG: hypothetical protein CSB37_02675 [bacterium DOLZORAL124_38_8]
MKKIILVAVAVLAAGGTWFLTGAKLPQMPKIIWEQTSDEVPTVATTISGVLFPFDVSVATKATHRLEKDNKLVALVASDVVNLEIFEGRNVDLTGFSKSEGKRNVFWVHSIDLKEDLDHLVADEELFTDTYVQGKGYTFLYPKTWEMFMAPDGALYFSQKGDVNRRAFFVFNVKDVEESDAEKERNVLISGLKGVKKITSESKREHQLIELFSADGAKKYVFQFNSLFEEFEKKQAFFALLNSFVTGDEAVQKAIVERKKQIADQKEKLLKKKNDLLEIRSQLEALKAAEAQNENGVTSQKDEEGTSVFDNLIEFTKTAETENENKKEVIEAEENQMPQVETKPTEETPKVKSDLNDFNNLINAKAYRYGSSFLKLSLQIPYGFWFQNFGNVNNTIATIGVQKSPIDGLAGTDFQIELIKKEGGVSAVTETEKDGKIVIEMPRPGFKNSFIRISGSPEFRDAMHSVRSTIQ